jgi:BMFP domain-containing protein YqiC
MLKFSLATSLQGVALMTRSNLFRMAFAVALAASLLPAAAFCQSQDPQSVAEAARRAREKKKDAAKPTKVITDDTLDVKKGDIQSATAEVPKIPGAPDANAQPAAGNAANASTANATTPAANEKQKKELDYLKEQLKQALGDLDLLQRENRLDQDAYYSKPDYASDAAGKQKLDDEKQAISDKREEVERLKAKVADLQRSLNSSSSAPSQP